MDEAAPETVRSERKFAMSAQSKTSMVSTMLLLVFGIAAFCGGPRWLAILIPAAILVWYGSAPLLRIGRN
jgi:hypothetical protein